VGQGLGRTSRFEEAYNQALEPAAQKPRGGSALTLCKGEIMNYWVVGASWSGVEHQDKRFVDEGFWLLENKV